MKIAFDVGGVLSKHPAVFFALIETLSQGERAILAQGYSGGVEVHIISDMHPKEKITEMLRMNGYNIHHERVHSADYKTHGELCKQVLCDELGIDLLIDDFPGYVATGKHVRLLVMPDPHTDYYHADWKTDGSEGNFGRRNPPESKGPGRPKNPIKTFGGTT